MYPYYYYGFDWTYVLVLIGVLIVGLAQRKIQSNYKKYSQVQSQNGFSGRQVAQEILNLSGIYDVRIERVSGHLTDHYDSRNKVLRLSDSIYDSQSIAAVAVAAHECGHAVQDAQNYVPLRVRAALVPVTQFGSAVAPYLIMFGFLLQLSGLIKAGIIAFSVVLIFQLVTLPVEFNASSRALRILSDSGILVAGEEVSARKMLNAAAFTYVASGLSTALQLLRFVLLANNRRRRD